MQKIIIFLILANFQMNIEELKTNMEKKFNQFNSLEVSFKQEKIMLLSLKPLKSSGKIFYKKPNKLLWKYDEPLYIEVVINEDYYQVYYKNEKKAERLNLSKSKQALAKFFSFDDPLLILKKYFNPEIEIKDNYILKLKPIDDNVKQKIITLNFYLNKDFDTTKYELYELNGDRTKVELFDYKYNLNLDDKIFSEPLSNDVKVKILN